MKRTPQARPVTVEQYLTKWLTEHQDEWKPTTADNKSRDVEKYIVPHIGKIKIEELKAKDIKFLYKVLGDSGSTKGRGGLAYSTLKQVRVTLHHALSDAIVDELIDDNPAMLVSPKNTHRNTLENAIKRNPKVADFMAEQGTVWVMAYTLEEVRNLLRWLHDTHHPLELLANLALATNMRRGEMLALSWDNIKRMDSGMGKLLVREGLTQSSAGKVIGLTKTAHGIRVLYVPPKIMDLLDAYRERRGRRGETTAGLVFTNDRGRPMSPNAVSMAWNRMMLRYPYPKKITLHHCRHTYSTIHESELGTVKEVIADNMGHGSKRVTEQHYIAENEDRNIQAAEKLGEALFE
jgi:integrase